MQDTKLSANSEAAAKILKFFAWCIVIAVVIYSEIMFLGVISVIFPEGVLRIGAIMGAIATGASVLVLYAGKTHWFRPGTQLLVAWVVTGVEVGILILNDILAYASHTGTIDSYLLIWKSITPASPVVALISWGLLMYLDPSRKLAHIRMEMEDKMGEANLRFQLAQFEAGMHLKTAYLTHHTQYLQQQIESPGAQAAIEAGSKNITAQTLTGLTGLPVAAASIGERQTDTLQQVPSIPNSPRQYVKRK